MVNTNKLIRNYQGATGLKTGSTSLALYNLSASATRNNLSLIAVILKAPTTKLRFEEAQKLLDYGFNNYTYKELAKASDTIESVFIDKGIENSVNAIYKENFGIMLKKGEDKEISQNINLEKNLSAPIYKGQKLGEVSYSLNGSVLGTVDIISDKDVKKINLLNTAYYLYKYWFCLLR